MKIDRNQWIEEALAELLSQHNENLNSLSEKELVNFQDWSELIADKYYINGKGYSPKAAVLEELSGS